ncbi:hypothetical protein BU23DRAFT_168189 [Bimuria novae-zelandiae CBS 107.79]|uniref:Ubiquitin-like protease family profile domain-containing protein n=1 Tax=Bimuria novae-zelandiae CBS 107.79 TaxID=1447943 RepID=A0A6A5V5M3_9PLEO|nr:hypothetical protein BU23DRAFT_168189 [Bimuria novae-zelandiae CBS 107.79]
MSSSEDGTEPVITFPYAELRMTDLDKITEPSSWFTDRVITVFLAILERTYDCPTHHIALVNCIFAQWCYTSGTSDVGTADYWTGYAPLLDKLAEKDFVIIPISDGLMQRGTEDDNDGWEDCSYLLSDGAQETGKHWSLVVADIRGQILKAKHFDSNCTDPNNVSDNRIAAECVMHGLRRALECNVAEIRRAPYEGYQFTLFAWTPHQLMDNACMTDGGACGLFICGFAEEFVKKLSSRSTNCKKKELNFRGIVKRKRSPCFDSELLREYVRNAVEAERVKLVGACGTAIHDKIRENIMIGSSTVDEEAIEGMFMVQRNGQDAIDPSSNSDCEHSIDLYEGENYFSKLPPA